LARLVIRDDTGSSPAEVIPVSVDEKRPNGSGDSGITGESELLLAPGVNGGYIPSCSSCSRFRLFVSSET
jgi:hypothetical protein